MVFDAISALNSLRVLQSTMHVLFSYNIGNGLWPDPYTATDFDTFDYIIAGGGTGGSVVANRLSEDSTKKILVIEAGNTPDFFSLLPTFVFYTTNTRMDWNYTSTNYYRCLQQSSMHVPTGRVLSGSSAMSYNVFDRGNPAYYDRWATLANDDSWNYENVLKYFKKSEKLNDDTIMDSPLADYHGKQGPVGLTKQDEKANKNYLKSFKEMGYETVTDLNANASIGFNEITMSIDQGLCQIASYAYIAPIKERSNLYVLPNTLVEKVLFDGSNVAIGVKVITSKGKLTLFANNEVILSAGAIRSPQILMLSGIGPKADLENLKIDLIADLPVGKNMQGQIGSVISYGMEKTNGTGDVDPNAYPAKAITGAVALKPNQNDSDYRTLSFHTDSDTFLKMCLIVYNFDTSICQKWYNQCRDKNVFTTMLLTSNLEARGEVTLKSKDATENMKIKTPALTDGTDFEKHIVNLGDFMRVENTTHFKNVSANLIDVSKCTFLGFKTKNYYECVAKCLQVSTNFGSTCAMGSVVDSELKVIGVKKLRVVDASIMPVLPPFAYAGTLMLAEKASDMIKEDNK